MDGFARYAVYYAPPPGSALWRFGCAWLGWDAEAGRPAEMPDPPGLPAPREVLTRTPRRYGFHATLKPPFRLAPGRDPADLHAAVAALAAGFAPFDAPPLRFAALGGRFAALVPSAPSAPLAALAAACVTELDGFRAPPDADELARRRATALTPAQAALLDRWGYPYVLDQFRFHLTLSGPLESTALHALQTALGPVLDPLTAGPMPVRDLALFGDPGQGLPFRLLARLPLGG